MGYAIPKGPYHKGPKKKKKKNVRTRKPNKPSVPTAVASKPTDKGLSPNDEALVKLLVQMDNHDMGEFIKATAHPDPRDVVIVKQGERVRPIVLDDADARQTHSGMVYVAGLCGGFGGSARPSDDEGIVVTPVRTEKVAEPTEKVIGNIVRKANGEIVLKFF